MLNKKIVLIQPSDLLGRDLFLTQPLSFEYVASSLMLAGFKNIFFIDTRIEKISPEQLPVILRERYGTVDFVCFTIFSQYFDSVKEYAKQVKAAWPDVVTIGGGAHAILEPEQTLRLNQYLDFAFCGEAEESLPEFIRNFNFKERYKDIPNLVFRQDGRVIVNQRKFLDDLSKCPNIAHELIRPDIYPAAGTGFIIAERKAANIIATRGCPFNCSYCGATQISGARIRVRPVAQIIGEMRLIHDKYNIREFRFLDDNLTFDRGFILELVKAIDDEFHGRIKWACPNGVRIDRLDPATVMAMEKSGCYYFAVGVESGNERVLNLMKRGGLVRSKPYMKKQIEMIKQYTKIKVVAFFILGFPGATRQEDEESIKFANELALDGVSYHIFSPIPGSDEWTRLKKDNPDIDSSAFTTYKVTYAAAGRSIREIKFLKLKAFLSFYIRPRIMWETLKCIRTFDQVKLIVKRLMAM